MPTYHYRCPNGHDFDRFEKKITDKTRVKCPECGKMAVRQISGGAGVLFKGSGFYATDYRKPAPKEPSESTPTETSKAEGQAPKTEKKSDKPSRVKEADH